MLGLRISTAEEKIVYPAYDALWPSRYGVEQLKADLQPHHFLLLDGSISAGAFAR